MARRMKYRERNRWRRQLKKEIDEDMANGDTFEEAKAKAKARHSDLNGMDLDSIFSLIERILAILKLFQ